MSFESELSQGIFCIPKCNSCKEFVWPPTEFCDVCNEKITIEKGDFEGKIIEFSKQNEDYFCIVEFEKKVRIMAKMLKKPNIDQTVKITKCGISDNSYFFYVN
ncbi:MAG: hypothetical protein HOK63_00925 [Thaumarchaeota archaeon]|jgi:hypothetical protein|nr:hypothetical protein [Nitrososphaerota archaeon]MBT5842673.1 hypothetical protein [Nitrososphaerota archaeon]MBT6468203.1 hypothetical protein [Nitrososphaerota archaeon]